METNSLQALLDAQAKELKAMVFSRKVAEETAARQQSSLQAELLAARSEKEKAVRDLGRLKQHLLQLETAESDKMDADTERIESLEAKCLAAEQRACQLEISLQQALTRATEATQRATAGERETVEEREGLRAELAQCRATLEAREKELDNLQLVLGQFYAESDGQERLRIELAASKHEVDRLSEELQSAHFRLERMETEKEEADAARRAAEQHEQEGHQKALKAQDEVLILRRALEQSMVRLNRMSTDSDFYVDRRIVIKLLVTYFEKNHSNEVLSLMSRILGFTEEEKARVGIAQQAGRGGVVRGVLGFSGRIVGGLLGAVGSGAGPMPPPDENQSFSDLWIDFLLKESEERERRERAEASAKAPPQAPERLPSTDASRLPAIATSASGRGASGGSLLGPTSGPQSPHTPHHANFPENPYYGKHLSFARASPGGEPPLPNFTAPSYTSSPQIPGNRSPDVGAASPFLPPSPINPSYDQSLISRTNSHGFLPNSEGRAGSPGPSHLANGDTEYQSGGEFQPVPLNNPTPPPLSLGLLASPYAVSSNSQYERQQSRSVL